MILTFPVPVEPHHAPAAEAFTRPAAAHSKHDRRTDTGRPAGGASPAHPPRGRGPSHRTPKTPRLHGGPRRKLGRMSRRRH
ncbi:conserved hypothetical protein [Streptomyces pristinaespiralis ATCC 25486]|uniref:Uncharacterized protein n=1 Tax=Streptomyces pristinaespiralis (strain ATCC 25486 / DSM 40338 / CBS 914.69 / JCM 4507 / KCC S-0507 / NBRC 13074 / NRRL 2958 / 5647) TaxID=457429 RepID=B5HFW9_STRE2|nr:conserved hypothetical protein [Streptomyces pristinaespiralis ATCC 25486]